MLRLAAAAAALALCRASVTPEQEAMLAEVDDECLATDDAEACALNAMQRRGFLKREAQDPVRAPDMSVSTDNGEAMEDESSAELESPDDEYLPDDDADSVQDETGAEAMLQKAARAKATWVEGVDKVAVTNCHVEGGNACPHGETCVVKHDSTWSQCVNCHKVEFGRECQKLGDNMRWAAIHTCKRSCLDSQCYNKQWCLKPYRCILTGDKTWGQCISCHSKKFWQHSCHSMKADLLEQAEATCHKKCKV
mmetsp:Transcript_93379/g.261177  ORF Transcript_93379/g.261177 Transcript_93379/m.261177 type:complete len:251 (+) Transcript_93379:93-845(+)